MQTASPRAGSMSISLHPQCVHAPLYDMLAVQVAHTSVAKSGGILFVAESFYYPRGMYHKLLMRSQLHTSVQTSNL